MEKGNLDFLEMAKNIKGDLVNWRRHFHMNPELGYNEYNTSAFIKKFLSDEGIEYTETALTGISAIIKGNGSKTVALRADMDALPLQENNKCEYSSKNAGKMHACGHDAHMTILLGCAKILNSMKDKIPGNIKLLFEPAEETTGGARIMIKEGVLNSPEVDGIIGLHVDENINTGFIGVKSGVVNAASNPFTVTIKGKGGHGAHPDSTIDPIVISCEIINSLQLLVSRELPPTSPAVLTIGYINGGTAQNIIPEQVTFGGIIRTMTTENREYVKKRLKEIVSGISSTLRGSYEINIEESYPCLYNNDNMVDILMNSASSILSKDNILLLKNPSMGVESFAYFSLEKPSVFYFLGSRNEERGIINPAHGSLFDIDEDCLPIGVAIQCNTAMEFLYNLRGVS